MIRRGSPYCLWGFVSPARESPVTCRRAPNAPPTGDSGSWFPRIALTLIIGQYAMDWHLGKTAHKTVTEKVRHGQTFGADKIILPHPSPRNNIWLKKNLWFESDVLPDLKSRVRQILYP